MKIVLLASLLLVQPALVAPAIAQSHGDAPAERTYPAEVSVRKTGDRVIYVTPRKMTLYTLDARVAFTRGNGTQLFCIESCARQWAPLAAPADAKPIGDWTVTTRGGAPQWAYRNRPVFTHLADRSPGDMRGDGIEDLWDVIAYVPPPPKITAPASVAPLFLDDAYVLADTGGHVLFTGSHEGASPFLAGIASRDLGEWTVLHTGDHPQWAWRGKPVFVSSEAKSSEVPHGAAILRP
ncbi:hypothetical protein [Sphingomonas sp. G-3-2-10]|uniref:COG4315 family predicted lipoprotein n=1 Tax=Sphingomonas sp. G-3-2-10 TaxID=2728838 RepID=UPI00146CA840|nr:hypothetical protein [Sphingomonas sp. G-3-2-10]NML05821.1 hypothetical protein [Sphingomonas sp. G-3-2-10]